MTGAADANPETFSGTRQVYLAQLAAELVSCGLAARTMGQGDDLILRALHPATGRAANVVCVDAFGAWVYVWPRGGQHAADDPAGAANEIARYLS